MIEGLNRIGLGTAALGRPQYINIRERSEEEFSMSRFLEKGRDVLDAAYQLGVRYFDTAPGYGAAEDMLINWAGRKLDSEIDIATKWGYTYVADFDPSAQVHEVKEHSLAKLNSQWSVSKRLLPAICAYQIHSATFASGVLENQSVLQRLHELKNEHSFLIGITTSGADQLEVIKKAMDIQVAGEALIDTFQVTYNIFDQSLAAVASELHDDGRKIIVKEAMANGRIFPNPKYGHYQSTYDLLQSLAKKYNVGLDAVALRFCLDSIPSWKVLSGASNIPHLEANLLASSLEMDPRDIQRLQNYSVTPASYWSERKKLGWN